MSWKNQTEANDVINSSLKPILESWIGGEIALKFFNMYGVRRYYNGSSLALHLDRPTTHVISAILQIDQVNASWQSVVF